MDLLHMIGETPEGQWAVFSGPTAEPGMVSVVVPKRLWLWLSQFDPFSSPLALMEGVGRRALQRVAQQGPWQGPIWVEARDMPMIPAEADWYAVLRQCSSCGLSVPSGEVLEGLANALPPDSRGEIEVLVLCPPCGVQTSHRLTAWGIPSV